MSAIVNDAENINDLDPEYFDSKEKCEKRLYAIEVILAEKFNIEIDKIRQWMLDNPEIEETEEVQIWQEEYSVFMNYYKNEDRYEEN